MVLCAPDAASAALVTAILTAIAANDAGLLVAFISNNTGKLLPVAALPELVIVATSVVATPAVVAEGVTELAVRSGVAAYTCAPYPKNSPVAITSICANRHAFI